MISIATLPAAVTLTWCSIETRQFQGAGAPKRRARPAPARLRVRCFLTSRPSAAHHANFASRSESRHIHQCDACAAGAAGAARAVPPRAALSCSRIERHSDRRQPYFPPRSLSQRSASAIFRQIRAPQTRTVEHPRSLPPWFRAVTTLALPHRGLPNAPDACFCISTDAISQTPILVDTHSVAFCEFPNAQRACFCISTDAISRTSILVLPLPPPLREQPRDPPTPISTTFVDPARVSRGDRAPAAASQIPQSFLECAFAFQPMLPRRYPSWWTRAPKHFANNPHPPLRSSPTVRAPRPATQIRALFPVYSPLRRVLAAQPGATSQIFILVTGSLIS